MVLNISTIDSSISTSMILISMLEYLNNCTYYKPKVSLLNKLLKFLSNLILMSYKKSEDKSNEIKKKLNDRGIVNIIMSLLCDANTSQKTFFYLLNLSVELLQDGNDLIQSSFYLQFSTNSSSQYFFSRVNSYLIEFSSNLKSTYSKKIPIYKNHNNGCKIVIRFLQLLCENHNLNLQNYIRFQFKSRRNYNLVSTLIFFLGELLKKSYDHHFLLISQCLDTLTEFIQGPCKENQIEIIDSKFLEISGRILSYDEKSDSMTKYRILQEEILSQTASTHEFSGNCLKGWMIAHLKYKCLITLLSCLEGQTGSYVITRMIRSLNIEILKENIMSFYFSYTEMYPAGYYDHDLFDHHEENDDFHPEKNLSQYDKNPEYYQLIIEVGFLVYHLMCHFKDNDDPENKRIVENDLPDLLDQKETEKIFGVKLIGDLGKFGLGLLKTGFNAVNNIVKLKKDKAAIDEVEKSVILSKAYSFFQMHTGNIEIIYQNDIFRIYF